MLTLILKFILFYKWKSHFTVIRRLVASISMQYYKHALEFSAFFVFVDFV